MKRTTAALSVLAGAALFEAVLIPGVLIGAAAVLAPKLLPNSIARLGWRRPLNPTAIRPVKSTAANSALAVIAGPPAAPGKFTIKRAIVKTITFRMIATSLDFTSNYVVIGELTAAAALSTYGLVAGPLFFFAHEMLWHRFGSSDAVIPMRLRPGAEPPLDSRGELKINHALAKTITYRSIATTTDFTANYVVAGDLAAAAALTAFGFIAGPFVFYYHENAWNHFIPESAEPGSTRKPSR